MTQAQAIEVLKQHPAVVQQYYGALPDSECKRCLRRQMDAYGLGDLSGGGWHGGGHRGWGGGWRWSGYPVVVQQDQTPTWCWIAVAAAALLLVMQVGRR